MIPATSTPRQDRVRAERTTSLRHRLGRTIRSVLVVGVLASACSGGGSPGLEAASPGPDATVGGEIVDVQLLYEELIAEIDGSVTDPDGEPLDTIFRIDSTIQATIVFSRPLAVPGDYTVRHDVVTVDGSLVGDSYVFTYDPTAPAPRLVFVPEEPGTPWYVWAVAVGGSLVIIVLVVRLLRSLRRARPVT